MEDDASIMLEMGSHLTPKLDERSIGSIFEQILLVVIFVRPIVKGSVRCEVGKLLRGNGKSDDGRRIARSDRGDNISVYLQLSDIPLIYLESFF
jgi:hypothetical protein